MRKEIGKKSDRQISQDWLMGDGEMFACAFILVRVKVLKCLESMAKDIAAWFSQCLKPRALGFIEGYDTIGI